MIHGQADIEFASIELSGVPRGGVWGWFKPPSPEIPKFLKNLTGLQIERKMFIVPIPTS
jgi:hypothetical protein